VENWVELGRRLVAAGFVLGFTGARSDQALVGEIMARIQAGRLSFWEMEKTRKKPAAALPICPAPFLISPVNSLDL